MAISIDPATYIIYIPQSYLSLVSGTLYELDMEQFRVDLIDFEDSEEGMWMPRTHNHATEVTLSGVIYARSIEIRDPYTVQFEDTGTPYVVRCTGANHNLADVAILGGEVSVIVGNAAGLVIAETGTSGLTSSESTQLGEIHSNDELMRKLLNNRQEIVETSPGVWKLRTYDDDDSSVLLESDLTDISDGVIVVPSGAPAKRGKGA